MASRKEDSREKSKPGSATKGARTYKKEIKGLQEEIRRLKAKHENEMQAAKSKIKEVEKHITLKVHHDVPFRSAAEYFAIRQKAQWRWEENESKFVAYRDFVSKQVESQHQKYTKSKQGHQ